MGGRPLSISAMWASSVSVLLIWSRVVFVAPVVQLLLFGYAITTDVQHLPTIIFDQSHSQESRALIQRFLNQAKARRVLVNGDQAGGKDRGVRHELMLIPRLGAAIPLGGSRSWSRRRTSATWWNSSPPPSAASAERTRA